MVSMLLSNVCVAQTSEWQRFFYLHKPGFSEPDSALLPVSKEAEGEVGKASAPQWPTPLEGPGLPTTVMASANSRKGTAASYVYS